MPELDLVLHRHVRFGYCMDNGAGFTTGDIQQQLRVTLDCPDLATWVHTTLKTVRGVRLQPQGAGFAGNRSWFEICAFQQDIARVFGHPAVESAHDTGDCDRTFFIADGQHGVVQFHFLAVEQFHGLTGTSKAHVNAALQTIQVKGVHRLTKFHQDVIGQVNAGANAADTTAAQGLDHPQGRRRVGVDATNDPPHVTRAIFFRLERYFDGIVDGGRNRFNRRRR